MTLNIEEDLILPFITGLLAIMVTVSTFYISVSQHEHIIEELVSENADLFTEVSQANHEISELTKHLQYYRSTTRAIESLGASHTQAIAVIRAADEYSLDPLLLAALIASESGFKHTSHALPGVIGICGINTQCGSILPYSVYTDRGNIMDAAKLLRDYRDLYHSDFLAIKRYKGWSSLGHQQALAVMKTYRSIK